MKYYGLHWTSDDGTEIQARLALENLELWARSCPRGGEWSAWRRLDVVRGADGVLQEIAQKAIAAISAQKAASAASAELAERAKQADRSASADNAKRAEKAAKADNAAHADKADTADKARTADTAKQLAMAVTIALSGAVTGSTQFDGINNVTIQTRPGKEITDLQAALARLQQSVGGLAGSISGINAANGNLASRLTQLENRVKALEDALASDDKDDTSKLLSKVMNKVYGIHCRDGATNEGFEVPSWGEFWGLYD